MSFELNILLTKLINSFDHKDLFLKIKAGFYVKNYIDIAHTPLLFKHADLFSAYLNKYISEFCLEKLYSAINYGNKDVVKVLLNKIDDDRYLPDLIHNVKDNDTDMVDLILDKIDLENKDSYTMYLLTRAVLYDLDIPKKTPLYLHLKKRMGLK